MSTDFIWSNTSHLPFFEWIVRPRPDQCIKRLSFHGANAAFSETVSKCTQIVDLITPCFQNLEKLELHTDVFLNENSQEKIGFYHHVLSHCKAIRHLIICDRVRFHRDEEKMLKPSTSALESASRSGSDKKNNVPNQKTVITNRYPNSNGGREVTALGAKKSTTSLNPVNCQ